MISRDSFTGLLALIIVTYLCCFSLIIVNNLKLKRMEERLETVEQLHGIATNCLNFAAEMRK